MAPRVVYYGEGPDGRLRFQIRDTALPCPGVALRLNTVIDCTPSEERMPPITIDFLKHVPPQKQSDGDGDGAGAAAAQLLARFTCDCGDFVLINQLRRVKEMVAAAGLPLECAPSVHDFIFKSASSGANSFYKAVAITVEAGDPGSIVLDEYEDDDEEEVPAGAAAGECAICYKDYVVGGVTSTKLPCGHTFHCRCLDRWTSVKRTCPYCRAPVPYEHNYWDVEDDDEEGAEEYYAEHYDGYGDDIWAVEEFLMPDGDAGGDLWAGEEEHRPYLMPGDDAGETPSAEAASGSQPGWPVC